MLVRKLYGGWAGDAAAIISASALNGKSGLVLAVNALPPVIRPHNRQGPSRGHLGRRRQAPPGRAERRRSLLVHIHVRVAELLALTDGPRGQAPAHGRRPLVEPRQPVAHGRRGQTQRLRRRPDRGPSQLPHDGLRDGLDGVQATLQRPGREQALRPAARPAATAWYPDLGHRELVAEVAPVASPPDQATAALDAHRAGHRDMIGVQVAEEPASGRRRVERALPK